MSAVPALTLERELLREHALVVSCDEVGRGALAGPVAVGATVLDAVLVASPFPEGLRDSKLIPEKRRPQLALAAAAWVSASSVGWASAAEIDEVGILPALGLAARRALEALQVEGVDLSDSIVVLDGNDDYITRHGIAGLRVRPVVKADRDCAGAAAASVIAKVARDRVMVGLHDEHPSYGWDRNKGYASAGHRAAIAELGLSPHHRASWSIAAAPTLF